MKIMKLIELHARINENHENYRIPNENHENHEHHRIPRDNQYKS